VTVDVTLDTPRDNLGRSVKFIGSAEEKKECKYFSPPLIMTEKSVQFIQFPETTPSRELKVSLM